MEIKNMIQSQKILKFTKEMKIGNKKNLKESILTLKANRKEDQLVLIAHMRDKRERKKD